MSPGLILSSFSRAAREYGFPALELRRKSWDKARNKATALLSQAGYSSQAKLELCALPSRGQNVFKYMEPTIDNLWLSYIRIPKSAQ
jgi:hypothetical protein